jgi:lipopolysaccharide export system protein LptA
MRIFLACLLTLMTLFPVLPCPAQEGGLPSSPIQIEADRMESVQEKNVITFSGHVEAKQDDLIIHADQITVNYTKSQKPGNADESDEQPGAGSPQKIDKIIAKGNVKIVQKDWVAVGDVMDYMEHERKAILSGNAKAWQGKNMVAGETIILYLDEGKSIVERSNEEGERVKALIYPESQPERTKQ